MIITCFPMQNLLKCFAGLFWCMKSCCFLFCRSLPSFTTWVIIFSFAAMMWDVRIYNFKNEFEENGSNRKKQTLHCFSDPEVRRSEDVYPASM